MRKKCLAACLCASLLFPATASADVWNYEAAMDAYTKENALLRSFEIEDGEENAVQALAREDMLYILGKDAVLRTKPGEKGTELADAAFGAQVERVAVCDNGWSKVRYTLEDGSAVMGYIADASLGDEAVLEEKNDMVTSEQDCDILDYPGRKDGEVIGEILEMDEVKRTATVEGVWSQIIFLDGQEQEQVGYVPSDILESGEEPDGSEPEEGVISESEGDSIFAEAIDGVTVTEDNTTTAANGVRVGTPVEVSSNAALKSLGNFRITHYCPCSICCGPWANGITSTGVTAVTNHTIAVDPSVIPYGSQVVINGQVYVAEDCGGAIKGNRIDIYVATHQEGESKGVYYAEVYLIQ